MHIKNLFVLLSFSTLACGGATFEPADPQPWSDAGGDALPAADAAGDSKPGADGGDSATHADTPPQPDAPTQDAQVVDVHTEGAPEAGMDAPVDVVSEPSCTPTTVDIPAEADGMILPEGTNCGASISFTTAPCMDLNLSGSRVLTRFALSDDAVAALQAKHVTQASLIFKLASKLSDCDSSATGTAGNAPGAINTYALRSDWLEGGSYVGAQWCYRRGNGGGNWGGATNQWAQPGAAGNEDHGPLMTALQLDTATPNPEVPLDPAALVAWVDGSSKLSILVTPAAASSVMAYIRTHESGSAAVLRLAWCH
jgi:hypothetical protein